LVWRENTPSQHKEFKKSLLSLYNSIKFTIAEIIYKTTNVQKYASSKTEVINNLIKSKESIGD